MTALKLKEHPSTGVFLFIYLYRTWSPLWELWRETTLNWLSSTKSDPMCVLVPVSSSPICILSTGCINRCRWQKMLGWQEHFQHSLGNLRNGGGGEKKARRQDMLHLCASLWKCSDYGAHIKLRAQTQRQKIIKPVNFWLIRLYTAPRRSWHHTEIKAYRIRFLDRLLYECHVFRLFVLSVFMEIWGILDYGGGDRAKELWYAVCSEHFLRIFH